MDVYEITRLYFEMIRKKFDGTQLFTLLIKSDNCIETFKHLNFLRYNTDEKNIENLTSKLCCLFIDTSIMFDTTKLERHIWRKLLVIEDNIKAYQTKKIFSM